jgi:hydrogenase assembly chaperone HypC/HupF
MCRSIPGQVVEITDAERRIGKVQVGGREQMVNLGLFEPDEIAPGDWVLLQAGLATERLSAAEAEELLRLLDEIAQFYEEDE